MASTCQVPFLLGPRYPRGPGPPKRVVVLKSTRVLEVKSGTTKGSLQAWDSTARALFRVEAVFRSPI
eukprot:3064248-Rhodomonas_salina.1